MVSKRKQCSLMHGTAELLLCIQASGSTAKEQFIDLEFVLKREHKEKMNSQVNRCIYHVPSTCPTPQTQLAYPVTLVACSYSSTRVDPGETSNYLHPIATYPFHQHQAPMLIMCPNSFSHHCCANHVLIPHLKIPHIDLTTWLPSL